MLEERAAHRLRRLTVLEGLAQADYVPLDVALSPDPRHR
jgi:hypothetical protein